MVGIDGTCIEKCGDGDNYNLKMCDDGNRKNGDGCSSDCIVEDWYFCRGSKQGSRDKCYYKEAEFMTANVTWTNSVLVALDRPVTMVNKADKLTSDDLAVRFITRDGRKKEINWTAHVFRSPF